jgi:NADPH:quinone reductase-like Zn-dependent oxidoreductase
MDKSIKAVRFHEYGAVDRLVLESIPRPSPKAQEVLVEVYFAGVNPIDWKIRSGYMKAFMPVPLPYTPGIDFSGVVAELGSGVKGLKVGQPVFGIASGAYSEFAIAAETDIVPKPESLSFELAATVPVGALTAWKALEDAGVKAGQSVAVLGASGGVGMFAVQFAKLKGARTFATASSGNAEYAKSLGAEMVADYRKALPPEFKDFDAIIDTVGGDALEGAYALLKKGGTIVTVAGQASEAKAGEFGIKILGSGRGPASLLGPISEMLAKKSIRAEAGRIFALSEAGAAQDLSQSRHGKGRILLKIK